MSLPDIRLELQVKDLSVRFKNSLEERTKVSQNSYLMVDRQMRYCLICYVQEKQQTLLDSSVCVCESKCVCVNSSEPVVCIYMCVRGSKSGRGRNERIGEE